jgi:glycosyltransferase involved in cell wall biosynthesis
VSVERGHVERDGTHYLDTAPADPGAHAWWLLRHPVRYARFLGAVAALRKEMGSAPELVPWWRLPGVARGLDGVTNVHAHFGWSGATAALLLARLLGVPWSMTLHAKDIFAKRRHLRAKLDAADLVVTVCDYNKRWIDARHPPRRPIEVLTCGIELPASDSRPAPEVDVVAVARLIPKKGIDTLVRAMALLPGATAEVVGDGPELESLRAMAGPNVTFPGAMDHEQALDRIARAKAFCLPCRIAPDGDRDAMPTVIVESMMRGVPVVSTNVVGIPEMVDAEVGRLVEPDDVEALAAALREVLDDEALRERLGAAGARRARERFTVEGQAGRLHALFAGLPR